MRLACRPAAYHIVDVTTLRLGCINGVLFTLHFQVGVALRRVSKVANVALIDARVPSTESGNVEEEFPQQPDPMIGDERLLIFRPKHLADGTSAIRAVDSCVVAAPNAEQARHHHGVQRCWNKFERLASCRSFRSTVHRGSVEKPSDSMTCLVRF